MDESNVFELLSQLDDNTDDLEEVLQPLLRSSLSKSSNKLPLMDKAKLHVLITYTLESLIFSYLRLHGVDAKQHQVFRELTRVKQYFDKIKALETEPEERNMTLDKAAAGRFIKHGLAGNDKYDLERAEKQAKERALAQFKADMLAKKSWEEYASAQTNEESDDDSEGGVDIGPAAEPQVDANLPSKAEKKSNKEKTKDGKGPDSRKPKKGKFDKVALQEKKKERRQRKEEARKARKAP
ncbi:uncharacterized protein N7515_008559 [Penicillium bovifimosum]|uniref:Exosome complex protein n=1 Tax=Penicillium bovifimosum TaxID=126998 RepID=A0A9W9KWH5_9EURO|nr:uncharacterized protein N7515_008559 [Penicillium bovifimosum]KAJ5124734.1 hypothetical protein N7515_008559 [Penicillium bovifimosum]